MIAHIFLLSSAAMATFFYQRNQFIIHHYHNHHSTSHSLLYSILTFPFRIFVYLINIPFSTFCIIFSWFGSMSFTIFCFDRLFLIPILLEYQWDCWRKQLTNLFIYAIPFFILCKLLSNLQYSNKKIKSKQ